MMNMNLSFDNDRDLEIRVAGPINNIINLDIHNKSISFLQDQSVLITQNQVAVDQSINLPKGGSIKITETEKIADKSIYLGRSAVDESMEEGSIDLLEEDSIQIARNEVVVDKSIDLLGGDSMHSSGNILIEDINESDFGYDISPIKSIYNNGETENIQKLQESLAAFINSRKADDDDDEASASKDITGIIGDTLDTLLSASCADVGSSIETYNVIENYLHTKTFSSKMAKEHMEYTSKLVKMS